MIYLAIVVLALYMLFTVGFPFLMALLIALLIEPIVLVMTKVFFGKRAIASLLLCTLFLVLISGLGVILGVKGVKEIISLSGTIVDYIRDHYQELTDLTWTAQSIIGPITENLNLELNDFVKGGIDSLQGLVVGVSETLISMIQGVPNFILDMLIFVIALYLISITLPSIKKKILNLFDAGSHHKIELVMTKLYRAVFGFIRAQLIISFFIYVLCLIGFLVLDLKFPFATAGIVTAVDVLPIFGTGSVMVPLAIFYFVTKDFTMGFGLLILYGILFAFRRIIEPKILGDSVGMGALSALGSMYVCFKLVGVVGLFLGPAIVILINALISAEILKIKIKV